MSYRSSDIQKIILYSCNIGEGGIALAEAVHGSAPDIAGKVRFHNSNIINFHDCIFIHFFGFVRYLSYSASYLVL